jgi:hypothetical protein
VNDKKTWHIEGLRRLATNVKLIEFHHTLSVWAVRQAMNEGRSFFDAKDHPDVKAWRQFKDDIVTELNAAVKIGLQDFESDLASCRKLSIELSQGFYKEGSPLVFDAITEVTALADKLEYCTSEDGSKDTSSVEVDEEFERAIELWNANTDMIKKELEKEILGGNASDSSHRSFFTSVKKYSDRRYGKGHLRGGNTGSPRLERE